MIIILGTHRGGTSLVAGIVHKLGINLTPKLTGNSNNPSGFFEDIRVTRKNDNILSKSGGSWHNPPLLRNVLEIKNKSIFDVSGLVEIRKQEYKLWGWKDPRFNFTFPIFYDYLDNPSFICVYRNPLSSARSLNRRNKFPIEKGLDITFRYYNGIIDLFNFYSNIPRLCISYDLLVEEKKGGIRIELEKIARFINVDLTEEVYDLVTPRFKRF